MKCVALLALAVFPFTSLLAGPSPSPSPATAATPGPLIAPEKLGPVFPPAPEGWSASKPKFFTNTNDKGSTSVAMCEYTNESPDVVQSVTLTIADWGVNHPYLQKTLDSFRTESESTDDGFTKPITAQTFLGQEEADFNTKVNKISFVVADRYYVDFSFMGLAPEEMDAWPKRVDLKKLAEIK